MGVPISRENNFLKIIFLKGQEREKKEKEKKDFSVNQRQQKEFSQVKIQRDLKQTGGAFSL